MGRSVSISTTVETDVDVDIDTDDFYDDDLIDELEHRGYIVFEKNDPQRNDELIKDRIFRLKTVYDTMAHDFFMKELKIFFKNELN